LLKCAGGIDPFFQAASIFQRASGPQKISEKNGQQCDANAYENYRENHNQPKSGRNVYGL
jgi:hypothetical protein